ncbi:MAG: hypothetical protein HC796_02355 [Synechococcaceae cyanobacterium RL_1_2]|nr:hypothetical protein [Synechococcaceae cyanobacterium RL_1_2]
MVAQANALFNKAFNKAVLIFLIVINAMDTIVIFEQEEFDLEPLFHFLQSQGYQVTLEKITHIRAISKGLNRENVIKTIDKLQPQLILVTATETDPWGLELLTILKQDINLSSITLIVISDNLALWRQAMENQADDFLITTHDLTNYDKAIKARLKPPDVTERTNTRIKDSLHLITKPLLEQFNTTITNIIATTQLLQLNSNKSVTTQQLSTIKLLKDSAFRLNNVLEKSNLFCDLLLYQNNCIHNEFITFSIQEVIDFKIKKFLPPTIKTESLTIELENFHVKILCSHFSQLLDCFLSTPLAKSPLIAPYILIVLLIIICTIWQCLYSTIFLRRKKFIKSISFNLT